ncbi:hypothetical protein [uncultured Winogradskyella sp.]|uniref:hypothetical protein n=1 Tax=uncultured Winogradskyella sp. TaxID=395353 RepID=UPI00261CAE2E|nr:hypothetical protein [uncultured Winogradskyella sp.]
MTAHQQLVQIWDLSEFGVKTRVFEEYSQQMIEYIRKHPNYKDEEKIKSIIECVKKHSKEVSEEVSEMFNQINSISE